MPKYDETALLEEVAKGDEKSFRQLFDQYWDTVYNTSFAFTKSSALAEELTQDIFLKIWMQREKLSGIEKFKDYLFIIARNHIFNELRKKVHEQSFADHLFNYFEETANTPEQQFLLRETEQLINEAVKQLPSQQQLIYCLSRQQGLCHQEIADKLHISTNTVKSHINKALQFIRNYLQSHSETVMTVALSLSVSTFF